MEVLLVLTKIKISDLKSNIDSFKTELCDSTKIMNSDLNSEHIHVQVIEGIVPNVNENVKVAIFISSEKMKHNMGALIVKYKTELLNLFSKCGILLSKKEIEISVNPAFDIPKFIEQLKISKVGMEKSDVETSEIDEEFDYEKKSKQYTPVEPLYSFDRVILSEETKNKIQEAIGILECENKVFNEWGLYEIQPHPASCLSFFGPSGTGKTMAAEAVAQKLGKKILKVSYADVESKYHGEGPKMVKAIFLAAKNSDAVLFFDEADSLLSKRLTNVSQGSEQAINSMRSQLLICLEEFRGIVIFATNLVINYDQAFLTRLISIKFKIPDLETRKTIWDVHIKPLDDGKEHKLNIPLAENVNTRELAEKYEFVGREIRNAVVSACVSVALEKRDTVKQEDFISACEKLVLEKNNLKEAEDNTKSAEIFLSKAIKQKLEKDTKNKNEILKTMEEK